MLHHIDLTLPFDENIAHFSREIARTIERDGWYAHNLSIYSHAGTHMDAPIHFNVSSKSIDEWEIERFISDCHVIRIPDCEFKKKIKVNDLGETASRVQEGESLLFATGWSRYLGKSEYRNDLPAISSELADWMVIKKVNMVLVEPPSVADVNDRNEVTEIHRKLLGGDIIIVEGICNTEKLKTDLIKIMAFPLKIKNGDGAPARIIAVENLT